MADLREQHRLQTLRLQERSADLQSQHKLQMVRLMNTQTSLARESQHAKRAPKTRRAKTSEPVCVYRGQRLGKLNCGCQGQPDVYDCAMHYDRCVDRPTQELRDSQIAFTDGTKSIEWWAPRTTDSEDDGEPIGPLRRLAACSICPDRTPHVVLDADANGLGDIALACWYPDLTIHATGPGADVVRLFNGRLSDTLPPYAQSITPLLAAEYASREPRLAYRAKQLSQTQIRRPPYSITDADHAWAIAHMDPRDPGRRNVCITPQVSHQVRGWPARDWQSLADCLTGIGVKVFTLTKSTGQSITQAAALMNLCNLVITGDTGTAHIAGNMRITTLALLGPTLPSVFEHVPDVQTITSNRECTGCSFQRPYTRACSSACASLADLTVDQVYQRAISLLSTHRRYGRKHEIDQAICLFEKRHGRTIVEIGSTRSAKIDAEGCASIAWEKYGTEVYSIDVNRPATAYTRALCPAINCVTHDGIEYLRAFHAPIDLLYLDGLDGEYPETAAFHLACYHAARDKCRMLILIDDQASKGAAVIPAALADGWQLLSLRYQALLSRPQP